MPSSNGTHPPIRKQSNAPASACEQARRLADIHSDFVAIAYAMGSTRKLLTNRGRWFESCRNPKEYEPLRPYVIEDEMIHDAVLTVANRGTEAERKAVRAATVQYFETRCRLALEMLGETSEACPVALTLESNEEVSEAQNAMITAINSKTPDAFERASRELTEALSPMERLRDLCARRAAFITPRSTRLMQVPR